jgi:small-conductance mechanosensitive channel
MEQQNTGQDLFNDLSFDQTAKQHLRTAATSAMTIVVVAVIGYALAIFQLATHKQILGRASEGFDLRNMYMTRDSVTGAAISIAIGLLINFFLYRFASQTKSAIEGLNKRQLISGFNSLKAYFVILSVIMIIVFVVLLLASVYGATKSV